MEIRQLASQRQRVETGLIQFGENDWPGVFIRGDDVFEFHLQLKSVLTKDWLSLDADAYLAKEILGRLEKLFEQALE